MDNATVDVAEGRRLLDRAHAGDVNAVAPLEQFLYGNARALLQAAEAMDHLRKSFDTRGLLLPRDPFPLWMQCVVSTDHIILERDALKAEVEVDKVLMSALTTDAKRLQSSHDRALAEAERRKAASMPALLLAAHLAMTSRVDPLSAGPDEIDRAISELNTFIQAAKDALAQGAAIETGAKEPDHAR